MGRVPAKRRCRLHSRWDVVNIRGLQRTHQDRLLKKHLQEVRQKESEKAGLKPNIQKTKVMASRPITSWQIDGENMETVTDFIFFGSRITVDSDCSHEIKRYLLLGRKALTSLYQSPGEGNGYPLWFSCLEDSMERGAWWATVHGVSKNGTRLSNQHFTS